MEILSEKTNQSAPRIERSTLEFIDGIKCRRTLLFVQSMKGCWNGSSRPGVRMCAIKAKGIRVMSVYIDVSLRSPVNNISRSEYSLWNWMILARLMIWLGALTSIIANQWYHNSRISQLLLDIGKVNWVRITSRNIPITSRVFVFGLN